MSLISKGLLLHAPSGRQSDAMTNQESKQYKFLDLSGYMFFGKAAAIDLIREFKGYYVPHYRFEFPLIRIQDGIMDLEKALIDDWSPIRSDIAVKRFRKLITKMSGHKRKLFSLNEEELVSWNYHQLYGGEILFDRLCGVFD